MEKQKKVVQEQKFFNGRNNLRIQIIWRVRSFLLLVLLYEGRVPVGGPGVVVDVVEPAVLSLADLPSLGEPHGRDVDGRSLLLLLVLLLLESDARVFPRGSLVDVIHKVDSPLGVHPGLPAVRERLAYCLGRRVHLLLPQHDGRGGSVLLHELAHLLRAGVPGRWLHVLAVEVGRGSPVLPKEFNKKMTAFFVKMLTFGTGRVGNRGIPSMIPASVCTPLTI